MVISKYLDLLENVGFALHGTSPEQQCAFLAVIEPWSNNEEQSTQIYSAQLKAKIEQLWRYGLKFCVKCLCAII